MPAASWSDLQDADFKEFAITDGVRAAIKTIRKSTKTITAESLVCPTQFFWTARMELDEPLWDEVTAVILKCGGPGMPLTFYSDAQGETLDLTCETLSEAFIEWNPTNPAICDVLSRCLLDRVQLIKDQLANKPGDWWLRLVLNSCAEGAAIWMQPVEDATD